jgi:AraC-like DNA-binding protein
VLIATSDVRLGATGLRSTVMLERAVRGSVVVRDGLAFDTRYAAAVPGRPEPVGYAFLVGAGRLVLDRGETFAAPVALILADEEIERVRATAARTFRTDGERVDVIQLRFDRAHLRVPIGIDAGVRALSPACWDAARDLVAAAAHTDPSVLARLLDALASAGVIAGEVTTTLCTDEPERFRRLWTALEPLYATYGATTSLKQLASSLGMSMRQVGRDVKELSSTFRLGAGYRDWLLVLRLRVAALLLSGPGATVGEVAERIGYSSPIALARAFRDAGLPPPSVIQDAVRGPT